MNVLPNIKTAKTFFFSKPHIKDIVSYDVITLDRMYDLLPILRFLYEDDENMSLVIKNVTSADAGEYHVIASNDLGEDTTTMNLVVKQAPKIKKKIENQTCMVSTVLLVSNRTDKVYEHVAFLVEGQCL